MSTIDVENMTEQQLEEVMTEVSTEMDSILVKAKDDVNSILEKYGLCIELGFEIKLKG